MFNKRLVESGNDAGSQLRVQRSTGQALVAVLALLAMPPALAGPIDLNLFHVSPDGDVTIDSTGFSATMREVATTGDVALFNNPALPDNPILINPSEGPNLRFHYVFNADCDGCDALQISLFSTDPTTEWPLQQLFFDVSGAADVSFVLPTLAPDYAFGLQFELLAFDIDTIGASAIINGLEVYDPAAVTVPEPGTLALLLSGLTGIAFRRRLPPSSKSLPA